MRHAKLKPQFVTQYPEVPPDRWLPAWQAATRRAERVWRELGAEALLRGRLLPDEHFDFQGGKPRPAYWYVAQERLSDATAAEPQQDVR